MSIKEIFKKLTSRGAGMIIHYDCLNGVTITSYGIMDSSRRESSHNFKYSLFETCKLGKKNDSYKTLIEALAKELSEREKIGW